MTVWVGTLFTMRARRVRSRAISFELAGLVPERFPLDPAGLGREGAGLYRARVDVGSYESGSIVHRKPLP